MTPTQLPRRLRAPGIGVRRGLQLTLAAATAVCLTTAPGARAMPIAYVIDPGAIFAPGVPGLTVDITMSGTFTFDASSNTESNVLLTLVNPNTVGLQDRGLYTQIASLVNPNPAEVVAFQGLS